MQYQQAMTSEPRIAAGVITVGGLQVVDQLRLGSEGVSHEAGNDREVFLVSARVGVVKLFRGAGQLLRPLSMPDAVPPPDEDEERVSKRVVYEHSTSSSQNLGAIIAIVVIAVALVVFIFMKMH